MRGVYRCKCGKTQWVAAQWKKDLSIVLQGRCTKCGRNIN